MRNLGKTIALSAAALSMTIGASAMAATPAPAKTTKTATAKHVSKHEAKKAMAKKAN